ncbi:MAG: DUF3427 domain-containing protein [Erysipelotrichaceae bacterium]|nr:DUF3427 domain-containing protein [Erysipelotrichaceae bacterium]
MNKEFDYQNELHAGYQTAILNKSYLSNLAFRPKFLSNNPATGQKVLASIEQELLSCDKFRISVAFITKSGITPLLQTLKDLEEREVPGEILTTDYLCFSEPEALERLAELKNIKLKMYRATSQSGGFHTKGYIFRQGEVYSIIIGSSNLTLGAITRNKEWNTKIISTSRGEIANEVLNEYEELWNSKETQDYKDFIDDYRNNYEREKKLKKLRIAAVPELDEIPDNLILAPNKMQEAFINNVLELRRNNVEKALLTSSTGTGKTYASAFAMHRMNPKRILFIVHRELIAKQAMTSYKRIFGKEKTYGLISGNSKETDKDFIFSTMQMMAKPEMHTQFDPAAFDAIILDECHHAGSESYQRIMSYFKPKFWLGMTASPDTNNYDIYSLFDHNIAYEIRLQQALEEDLLCPFHYFGITDLEINGQVFDDDAGLRNFANLVSEQRVDYVIEKAEYFGYSGERVKGLIFCSRIEEAKELSAKFNNRIKKNGKHYSTMVLTGNDNPDYREKAIARLVTNNDNENPIDYIFTVDIFNEGVDIPEINQVIMLRPTESPVVFIQQLGRGLRKYKDKEYVVILDFIGNYTNNYMIPIALSGDRSYNKDTIRKYIREGSKAIPGSSTIHFDEVSKKRIYASLDSARTNDVKLLRESYASLKYKLGRIPSILEFKEHGSIDVMKIFQKFGSYHAFLKKYEPDYHIELSSEEENVIEFMSRKVVSFKRIHDLAILEYLTYEHDRLLENYCEYMKEHYDLKVTGVVEESVYRNLTNAFPQEKDRSKYSSCVLIERTENGSYKLTTSFEKMLENDVFKMMVLELLHFGKDRYAEKYNKTYKDTCFDLYEKYTYEDVCRLLGWKNNQNAQNIGGYFYDANTKTMPVFINYQKSEDAIAYDDRFLSEESLIALSKHPRNITSSDAVHIYRKSPEDKDNRIFLFVRKNKDDNEAKEFYFLGEVYAEGEPIPIHMEKTNDNAFEIEYRLDVPVRSDIYDYIVKE